MGKINAKQIRIIRRDQQLVDPS